MHAVGVAQARRADLAVQQGVVNRVKHPVAHASQRGKTSQHPVTGADGITEGRNAQQGQAAEQNWTRTHAVHHKTRQRLHRARDHKKYRHQKTQLRVTDVERLLEPRKQRRQQQLAVVADQMRQTDQADDAGVTPQGNHTGWPA